MTLVVDSDEVMFITERGILMRTPVGQIRETGRNAQGVRLIRIDEGDRLVAMARVDAEEVKVGVVEGGAPPQAPAPEAGGEPEASVEEPPADEGGAPEAE